MTSLPPRVVLVRRQTEYASLLAAHATRGQAEFFLQARGQSIAAVETRDRQQAVAMLGARHAVPPDWSFAQVMRDDLNRFLFTANDIVVAVGQDGLVAYLAKYLSGQPVVGISPDPALTEGILTGTQIAPTEDRAAFFAREPGPSRISGAAISAGEIGPDAPLSVLSRLNEGGVIFADGIEQDFLPFNWGVRAEIGMANQKLRMVAA